MDTCGQLARSLEEIIMLYIVIENDKIVSKLSYKPNVPDNSQVKIIEYTGDIPDEFISLINGAICDARDYELYKGKYILATTDVREQIKVNKNAKAFLNNSDWKILRHMEQVAKSLPTSLSDEEYQNLLEERQNARERIDE